MDVIDRLMSVPRGVVSRAENKTVILYCPSEAVFQDFCRVWAELVNEKRIGREP